MSDIQKFKNFVTRWPWSAVFISYVMQESRIDFPFSSNHAVYSQKIRTGSYPWKVLNPTTTQLNVGDVVVQNRSNNHLKFNTSFWSGSGHGDIVVEVTNKSASVIGGNVGDTVKRRKVTLSNKILTSSNYFVVLRPDIKQQTIKANAIEEWTLFNNRNELDEKVALRLYAYYKAGRFPAPHPGIIHTKIDPNSIFWEPLLKIIRKAESTQTNGKSQEYDSVVHKKPIKGLSSLTIEEAINKVRTQHPKSKNIGAYQFNMEFMEVRWVKAAGLTMNDVFSKETQDKLAIWLIMNERKGKNWLTPPATLSSIDFMLKLSQEWAGLPCPINTVNVNGFTIKKGQSYWSGVGGNRANISLNEVNKALNTLQMSQDGIVILEEDELVKGVSPVVNENQPFEQSQGTIILDESQYLNFIQD